MNPNFANASAPAVVRSNRSLYRHPIAVALVALCFAIGLGLVACGRETPPPTTAEKTKANAEDLRATLRDTVKDPARLQQMLTMTDQLGKDLESGMTQLETAMAEQDRLYRAYDTTPAALDAVGNRIEHLRLTYRTRIVKGRCAMAQLATDSEWKQIIDRDLALLGN